MSVSEELIALATATPDVVLAPETFFAGDATIKTGTLTGYKVKTGTFNIAVDTASTVNVGFKPTLVMLNAIGPLRALRAFRFNNTSYGFWSYDESDDSYAGTADDLVDENTPLTFTSTGFKFDLSNMSNGDAAFCAIEYDFQTVNYVAIGAM